MNTKFSTRLKALRQEKGLLQKDVAEILNVSRVTVTQYEIENRFPDQAMLLKIADFYDVSLDYLLGRTDYKRIDICVDKDIKEDDLEKNISTILKQGEMLLDERPLSDEEKMILESSINNTLSLIRAMRDREFNKNK